MDGWTPDETDKLIGVVRSNPVLYDQSLPGYSNRDIIDLAWRSVSMKFNNKSGRVCSKKWQLLRAGFRKRRHDYLLTRSSSALKKKKWIYFDALSFLDIHMAERLPEISAPQSSTDDGVISELDSGSVLSGSSSSGSASTHVGFYTVGEDGILEAEEVGKPNSPRVSKNVTCSARKAKKKSKLFYATQGLRSKIEKQHREKQSAMELFFESIVEEVNQLKKSDQMELRLMILNAIKDKIPQ